MASLVRIRYFISPEYYKIKLPASQPTIDQREMMLSWMSENCLWAGGRGENGEMWGLFMGEGRVLCDVHYQRVYQDLALLGSGAYNGVVQIKAQPVSRPLPSELTDLLSGEEFREIKANAKEIERLNWRRIS